MSFGLRPFLFADPVVPERPPTLCFWCSPLVARLVGVCGLLLGLAQVPAPLWAQTNDASPIPIYAIQGNGAASPLKGDRVTTFGLVTGVTVDGFFLQDPGGDGDPATSDGLFIYTWKKPTVMPGQCVQVVDGLVTEYYDKTELTRAASIIPTTVCRGTVTPVDLPAARWGVSPTLALEPWEGMLVRLPQLQGQVHGPTRHFDAGEKEIALLPAHFTRLVRPGHLMHDQPEAATLLTFVNNRLGADLPEAAFGQELAAPPGLPAVVDYAFGKVQVLPLPGSPLTVRGGAAPPLPVTPVAANEYAVCSYNLNGLGRGQEQFPDADAYTAALAQRAATLASALQGCTIIALQETGSPADAANLAAQLASAHGLEYTVTAIAGPGSADHDFPLTNSLLTRHDRVQTPAAHLAQGCSAQDYGVDAPGACGPGLFPLFDRPPLVAQVEVRGAWQTGTTTLWVINNHWKSKAGDETVNAVRRMAQAQHVAAQVQAIVQANPTAQVIVLGDLNDFYGSPPVRALAEGVEPPLLQPYDYLAELDRYTYIFNGAAQTLDHLLITANLSSQIAGVQAVHLNADFPTDSGPVPGSDHDPVMLRLRPDGAAATGGDLGFGQIAVEALTADGARLAATVTNGAGDYRLWGLPAGPLSLRFSAPPGVILTPTVVLWEAAPGYHPAPIPQVHHQTALTAAFLAVVTPDLAAQSLAPSAR